MSINQQTLTVPEGLGDADASQVLKGTTFTSESGFNQEGTLDPVTHDEIVDNLVSESTDLPLSANQGRILSEQLGGLTLYAMSETEFETTEEDTENGLYILYKEETTE